MKKLLLAAATVLAMSAGAIAIAFPDFGDKPHVWSRCFL